MAFMKSQASRGSASQAARPASTHAQFDAGRRDAFARSVLGFGTATRLSQVPRYLPWIEAAEGFPARRVGGHSPDVVANAALWRQCNATREHKAPEDDPGS